MTESATTSSGTRLRITWTKSAIGYREQQRRVIRSLGLKKLRHTVEHYDSPTIRGMVNKVHHLVTVEPVSDDAPLATRETGTQRFVARLETRAAEYAEFINEMVAEAEAYEAEVAEAVKRNRVSTKAAPAEVATPEEPAENQAAPAVDTARAKAKH